MSYEIFERILRILETKSLKSFFLLVYKQKNSKNKCFIQIDVL
ncbi:hypothetical protein HMPREF3206_00829 [Fusobacterium equinum]|uniref:Uncharacterized protein n=1 Tax=Fusobacterium equinum TaxID=134605 RepID=A0A133NFC5_9FUSO|nr:hypothetical protein HMPREF3206_00829 [Fusobacterium equinum]